MQVEAEHEIEQLFNLGEVARILGFERSTVYSRIKQGRLKAVEIDGSKRVPRSELLRYLGQAKPVTVAL